MNCPHCGANQIANIEHPAAFECGSFGNTHRTVTCKAREPLFLKLKSAKARIEALVKVGDEIIENGSVSERLAGEWKKANANNT